MTTTKGASFDVTRKYGVEIEVYGIDASEFVRQINVEGIACLDRNGINNYRHAHVNVATWKVVHDGSVQGDNGFEVVSPPLKGFAGFDQIRKVCAVLNRLGAKVNASCGMHVHHDASAWQGKEFKNLLILYARMEPTLDEVVPSSRRNNTNTFCNSVRPFVMQHIDEIKKADTYGRVRDLLVNVRGSWSARYLKLNVTSFERHQTVEFRHHAGTTNADKIINWTILTQLIVQHSEGKTPVAKFDREDRFKNFNPYYCLTGDLFMIRRSFKGSAPEVQDCVHFYCERINGMRKAEGVEVIR